MDDQPDAVHKETVRLVRQVHDMEYQKLHPDIENILDALCGPEDPLTGVRSEDEGMKGQLTRIEYRQAATDQKVTELHKNGRVRFTKAFKIVGGSVVTGIFALLLLVVQHLLGG